MSEFEKRYRQLNPEQKQAVDTIEGPLMVIAGPGSGKTELLALRVANILRQVDVQPSNILCLTFTEAAAFNMRQRLAGLLGKNAYRIAIHTFHSFGVEIINRYPEHFYQGAVFWPADVVTQTEILNGIFESLSYDNPLASRHQDQFVYLASAQRSIEYLKRAGLGPTEFKKIVALNTAQLAIIDPWIQTAIGDRVSKKGISGLTSLAEKISALSSEPLPGGFESISQVISRSLGQALAEAEAGDSITPISDWKRKWTAKDDDKVGHLVDFSQASQVTAFADMYERYVKAMHEAGYYDFNDMILDTIGVLERKVGIRLDLQERFQYILVDEFQDTNDAQLRLLKLLTDHPVHEGRPNIMVVGDDDQAIYKFQGAEVSNILTFASLFHEPAIIALRDNYRSTTDILKAAEHIITQGTRHLKKILPDIKKELRSANRSLGSGAIKSKEFQAPVAEYTWIADEVKHLTADGLAFSDIAVIAREHRYLEAVAAVLGAKGIPVSYERQRNVLAESHIIQLVTMLRFVASLTSKNTPADELMPEILSYPFWNLGRLEVWDLSIQAGHERKLWLSVMVSSGGRLAEIAEFFIGLGQQATYSTAEEIIHELIGGSSQNVLDEEGDDDGSNGPHDSKTFSSPFRSFYFNPKHFTTQRASYLEFLSSLRSFITAVREYRRGQRLSVTDVVALVDMHLANRLPIGNTDPFVSSTSAVRLLTAHKSKGLEFEAVFVINCQEDVWSGRVWNRRLPLPSNLRIVPAGDTRDDQLRLFYVALTRAKRFLFLTSSRFDDRGRASLRLGFIAPGQSAPALLEPDSVEPDPAVFDLELPGQFYWKTGQRMGSFTPDERSLLEPVLESYQLSVTHLQNFLNVADGGPQTFIERNLLMFPEPKSPSAVFGSAIHGAIQKAYQRLKNIGRTPKLDDIIDWFEDYLEDGRLNERQTAALVERGRKALEIFYSAKQATFSGDDFIEFNFRDQGVVVDGAHLTGKLDRISVSGSEAVVYDLKTGKAIESWSPKDPYEKIKTWRYRQQIIFYKLLVEHSRDFSNRYQVKRGVLEFVEPIRAKKLIDLTLDIDQAEVERLTQLIGVVFKKIQALDFPDISGYSKDISGIQKFEEDLLGES